MEKREQYYDVVVIGGGAGGQSIGYYLEKYKRMRSGFTYCVLEKEENPGDTWRKTRWDSLKLFSPTTYSSLPGFSCDEFLSRTESEIKTNTKFLTRDQYADYLDLYCKRSHIHFQGGVYVTSISAISTNTYKLSTSQNIVILCNKAVIATGYCYEPKIPSFIQSFCDSNKEHIQILLSNQYKNPSQVVHLTQGNCLQPCDPIRVCVIGAGAAGVDIATDLSSFENNSFQVTLVGRYPGSLPRSIFGADIYHWLYYTGFFDLTPSSFIVTEQMTKQRGDALVGDKWWKCMQSGVEWIDGRCQDIIRTEDDQGPLILDVTLNNDDGGQKVACDFIICCCGMNGESNIQQNLSDDPEQKGIFYLGRKWDPTISSSTLFGIARDARLISNQIFEDDLK